MELEFTGPHLDPTEVTDQRFSLQIDVTVTVTVTSAGRDRQKRKVSRLNNRAVNQRLGKIGEALFRSAHKWIPTTNS